MESLTFESDFTAFLRPEVDDKLKRAALKQLFRDPRFNVMDGLDTYIDDYTKADPIAPDVLADLLQRGFGRAADTGQEQAAAVNAPRAIPATTARGTTCDFCGRRACRDPSPAFAVPRASEPQRR